MADITMPQLGETVTEGTITRWLKNVGDRVEEDEVLYEVSTDKVDSEVPSPVAGVLQEILVPEGETVEVGARLAVIGDGSAAGGAAPGTDAPAAEEPAAEAPASEAPAAEAPAPAAEAPAPAASPAPAEQSAPPTPSAPPPAPAPSEPAPPPASSAEGLVLSPVVRRLIAEHGLDATSITGTGAGGRITRSDVLAVIDRGGAAAPAKASPPAAAAGPAEAAAPAAKPAEPQAAAPKPAARQPGPPASVPEGADVERIPFSNIRKRTAEHMVRSQATSAHTLIVVEVDYDNVDRVRNANKSAFKAAEGFGLTYLPFIARATIDAIAEFPHVNASVGEGELIVHRSVNLGIAVDMDFQGLIVPVVHQADTKRLRALAREISDLANRARNRKLGADEISGGTFTITNAGGYGTVITAPIINQPQVAIIGTEGVRKRPVVVELPDGSDAIAIHPVGHLCLSFDHRAYDGAYASAFLARVRDILQTRDWAAELG